MGFVTKLFDINLEAQVLLNESFINHRKTPNTNFRVYH